MWERNIAVASTKSFNSSVLLLKLLTLWLYQEHMKTTSRQERPITRFDFLQMTNYVREQTILINQMIYQIKKINHEINIYLEQINIDKLVFEHIFILGKGSMEGIAKECALKLKEICYIHGEIYIRGGTETWSIGYGSLNIFLLFSLSITKTRTR